MKYLITYDVKNSKRWYKLFKYLKNMGLNVQLSCFEVEMKQSVMLKFIADIKEIINENEDSVYVFPLSDYLESMVVKFGKKDEINESRVV